MISSSSRRHALAIAVSGIVVGLAGAIAAVAPADAAPSRGAVRPADVTQSYSTTVIDPEPGCTQTFNTDPDFVSSPPANSVASYYTNNPCHLNDHGLEAGIQFRDAATGQVVTSWGNDVHVEGFTSNVGPVNATHNICLKTGSRWWNGAAWNFYWFPCP
jgi:hypothetical protein